MSDQPNEGVQSSTSYGDSWSWQPLLALFEEVRAKQLNKPAAKIYLAVL